MDTKKLRQKILDLAIHGKLVPDEGPWEEKTLGEVFQHNTGKALNKSDKQEGKLLSYITTSNLYWDHFELGTLKKMYFKDSEIAKCTVTKGDLLVCEGGDIGRSAIWNEDYDICIQNHIHRLRPIVDAIPKFYYYVMMFYKNTNNIEGKGIGMLGLSSKQLDKIQVPLPPLSEQKRIVAEVEKWFALIDVIENSQQDLNTAIDQAKNKILDLAIHGKLVPNEGPWEEKTLGEVCDYGKCSSVSVEELSTKSWVLELEDLEKDTGRIIKRLTKGEREIKGVRHSFKKGNVLYSKLRTYLNKVLVAPEDGYCTTEIIPITTNATILPEYLNIVMRSPYFLEYTAQCGYGVKMPRLSTSDAKKAIIPLPPLSEQKRIVEKIEQLFAALDAMKM